MDACPPIPDRIPDLLEVSVPIGARVLVVSELHLDRDATGPQQAATDKVAQAIDSWAGPGVVVIAGGLFGRRCNDPAATLASHPRLVGAIAGFANGTGRRVVVLPGAADAHLAWGGAAPAAVRKVLHAELALEVDLAIETGSGCRRVRVEPGRQLDRLAAVDDPYNRGESPLAQHLVEQVMPAVLARQGRGGWLSGMTDLDDPAALPRFLTSRLTYRKLARQSWLVLVPLVVAIVLGLPTIVIQDVHTTTLRIGLLALAAVAELAALAALGVVSVRRTWHGLAGLAGLGPDDETDDANRMARARARELVTAGAAGLITGHTCRPELSHLGAGFYANTGCVGDVVSGVDARPRGLGLPAVFLAHRQVAWVELEAGGELHVRLFHTRHDLSGATVLERLVIRRGPEDASNKELRPELVATFPQGQTWPPVSSPEVANRRSRRLAASFVALAGLVSLVSSLVLPLRNRLSTVRDVFPLAVPRTASALVALGGITLIMLARGIRRGQRRAWVVTEAVIVAIAVLYLLKGVQVEQAAVAIAVAVYLWLRRDAFGAKSDIPPVRRGLLLWVGAVVATLAAGTVALEVNGWRASLRYHHFRRVHRIGWWRAFQASAERMVGITHIRLPDEANDFFSPAMTTAAIALAVVLLAMLFRPVAQRRLKRTGVSGASGSGGAGRLLRGGARASEARGGASAVPETPLARARAVVAAYGSGTLDYFALRADKEFFFWGATMVAYAVYGGVCLVSPDPIGPVAEREEAWRAFRAFADEQGWALGGLGAGEEWLPIYRASGMHDLYVGDEAVVRVERFSLEGKRFKGLRQAVNRVAKYGYSISFHDPAHLDPELAAALRDVMTKSRRGDVERGFSMTLGRVFDPDDAGLLLAVVHAPPVRGDGAAAAGDGAAGAGDGAGGTPGGAGDGGAPGGVGDGAGPSRGAAAAPGPPVAFCQYVPASGIGGYSLDLMRRDDGEHPNGLIDFAVVETIRELARRGDRGLGLNFATMRAVLAGEAGEGLTQRVQAWLLRRMGDSMQIESLWRFNAKFDPDWQPRYAIYDAPENAPAVAVAMARAESWWELPVIGRFLTPTAERSAAPTTKVETLSSK